MRTSILLASCLTVASCQAPAEQTVDASRPNVIVIFTDDQGYQDLGCYGSPNLKTPHLDRLAREGMRFTDFYSADPVCTPSRAALLTGCYPQRVGNLNVLWPDSTVGLNPDETTLAELLKVNGYATACIGKWHLGHLPKFLPMNHGFDSYLGIPYSNDMSIGLDMKLADSLHLREGVTRESMWEDRKNWVPLMRDDAVIEYPADQSKLTKRYTDEALKFMRANRDQPFFLYMPHTMPHIPLFASEQFAGTSEAGLYGDCIEEIDWSVGQIVSELERLGLAQNTLVIYTSDNGPWDLKGNATDKVKGNQNRRTGGSALPLSGFKFQIREGGMRVPAVMWWPEIIPANTVCSEVAATIDILPTIAEIVNAPSLPQRKIDGISILPLLTAQDSSRYPSRPYFYRQRAVRLGKWKGFLDTESKAMKLYNLETDIAETTDVAAQHSEVVKQLQKLLHDHCVEINRNKRPPGNSNQVTKVE